MFFFVNEAAEGYHGTVTIPYNGPCCWYNPWRNAVHPVLGTACGNGLRLEVVLEPSHSLILLLDEPDAALLTEPVQCTGQKLPLEGWRRSVCAGTGYPHFEDEKPVSLPGHLAEEQPEFSGFVRYESAFELPGVGTVTLEITDAYEGVEVFVNGQSAGIQIVPPFRYDLTALAKPGRNALAIEVATTLERHCYPVRGWQDGGDAEGR